MKIKVKLDKHELISGSGYWNIKDTDRMIINFVNKWQYINYKQIKNVLRLYTYAGNIDLVFCGEVPKVHHEIYSKDQLILKLIKQ